MTIRTLLVRATVLFSQGMGAIASLATSFILTLWVGKEELGQFFFFNAAALAVTSLLVGPLGSWLTRSQYGESSQVVAIQKLWIYLAAAFLVTGVAALSFAATLPGLAMLYAGIQIGVALFAFGWNARGQSVLFSVGAFLPPALRLLALAICVASVGFHLPGELLAVTVISAAISLLLLYLLDLSMGGHVTPPISRLIEFRGLARQLRSGRGIVGHMMLASIVYTGYQFADKLAARLTIGFSGLAELSLLMQWSYMTMSIGLQPFIALAYPKILQGTEREALRTISRFAGLFFAMTCVGVIAAVAMRRFGSHLVPEEYAGLLDLAWLGVLAGGIFMIAQIATTWFSRSGNERYQPIIVIGSALVSIVAIYIGARWFGLLGIVLGHLLYSVAYLAASIVGIARTREKYRG